MFRGIHLQTSIVIFKMVIVATASLSNWGQDRSEQSLLLQCFLSLAVVQLEVEAARGEARGLSRTAD